MKVISRKLWSPQEFVEAFTGECYVIDGDNDSILIRNILAEHGYPNIWDYMLDEIDNIPENVHQVVLVDCLIWNEQDGQYHHSYRWFHIPDEKIKNFAFKN
jgi:hypothetical protein